ncbi:protein kinase [Nocardia huaxiensis]|uniref:non-specific serine/threonine protein kinase n=1 Tax=Nocardia huaxiensis TaxID=2755382 RepID=A0A7D6ZWB9_9NOCA|nr:serine/threonine-protein kinase [Nocardia huaxiensis]QLY30249.1 protein kinase [Nocardia huaxiensis]
MSVSDLKSTDIERVRAALPGYEVGGQIGRGGCGVVLAGVHRGLNRRVAIKQIPPQFAGDMAVRRRFVAEARMMAALDHPHVVPVYDYIEHDDMCLLVLEFLPGGTVEQRFVTAGFEATAAVAVALSCAAGLDVAHRQGILHRDVKPSNLMFSGNGTLKLTDFGIAKIVGGDETLVTRAGEILGTPSYIAPEQVRGQQLSPATDVYALATMLYQLLSGTLPFPPAEDTLAMLFAHAYGEPVPLDTVAPTIPQPIADVVMRGLAPDPDSRFDSAESFGVALAEPAAFCWGTGWLTPVGIPVVGADTIVAAATGSRTPARPLATPFTPPPRPLPDPYGDTGESPLPSGPVTPQNHGRTSGYPDNRTPLPGSQAHTAPPGGPFTGGQGRPAATSATVRGTSPSGGTPPAAFSGAGPEDAAPQHPAPGSARGGPNHAVPGAGHGTPPRSMPEQRPGRPPHAPPPQGSGPAAATRGYPTPDPEIGGAQRTMRAGDAGSAATAAFSRGGAGSAATHRFTAPGTPGGPGFGQGGWAAGPMVRVRPLEPIQRQGVRLVDVERSDLVPIQQVVKLPSPRMPFFAAAALALLVGGAAVLGVGGAPERNLPAAGAVRVAGVDPAVGTPVELDLSKAVPITVSGVDADSARLSWNVLGQRVGGAETPLQGETAVPVPLSPYVAAGDLTGELTLSRNGSEVAAYRFGVRSTQRSVTTALAAGIVLLALFALAYAESNARSLRRGSARFAATVGLTVSAGLLGVAAMGVSWILFGHEPTVTTLVLGAVGGAAAGFALAMGCRRVGKRYRYVRLHRQRELT